MKVRSTPVGSAKLRRAADRMAQVAWELDGAALQQLIWWAPSTMPEAPPDARETPEPEPPPSGRRAMIFQFPQRETSPDAG